MKTFIIHWQDGAKNEVSGNDIGQAFIKAGYNAIDLLSVENYEEKTISHVNNKQNEKASQCNTTRNGIR